MTQRTCSIDDCGTTATRRGWCDLHYRRWRRTGDPEQRSIRGTADEIFWAKVDKQLGDGCWLWTAATDSTGYGRVGRDGKLRPAHRVAYELSVGPIPDGHDLDHMCWNRLCVNPDHLRPATRKQNLENLRGAMRNSQSGVRGVSRDTRHGDWVVYVRHHGRSMYVGRFKELADAEAAAIARRNELYTHNDVDRRSA